MLVWILNLLSMNELKETSFSFKIDKSLAHDEMSFNVIGKCFSVLHEPFLCEQLLLIREIFDDLKIAKVSPIYIRLT